MSGSNPNPNNSHHQQHHELSHSIFNNPKLTLNRPSSTSSSPSSSTFSLSNSLPSSRSTTPISLRSTKSTPTSPSISPSINTTGANTSTLPTQQRPEVQRHSRSPSPPPSHLSSKSSTPQPQHSPTFLAQPNAGPAMPVSPAEDSSFDDGNGDSNSLNSATTSLSSSIYNSHFVYGGRRYHCYRGTDYNLPIDDDEQRRLELMHTLWQVVGEGDIYKAPIPDNVQRVLDLGTGTGNWAIQFADSHPSAIVLGIDTSPIFPTWVPPNAQFELDNIESTWHMSSQNYDYIHIRNLSGSIRDWPALLQNIYDHLAPGGWLEIQEGAITEPFSVDGSYKKGGAYGRFNNLLRDSAVKSGKRLDIVPELPGWILATGFVDLHNKKEVCPIGRWPKDEKYKERGRWGLENLDLAMEAYGLLLMTQYGGLDEVEVREIIEDGKNDLWDKKIHMCFGMHFIYARKPMEGESTWT